MKSNKKFNLGTSEWLKKPLTKLTASIIGIATIFGFGYGVGTFKENIDWKIEKMELNQKFNEQLQKQIDDCRKSKMENYRLSSDEIERVVSEIRKKGL